MKFERGKDIRKSLDIGINPLPVEGISVLKSIDYTMAGECWNWKFIKPRRKRIIKKILRKLSEQSDKRNYSIWTPDGHFYNDHSNYKEDEWVDGKTFVFDGEVYQIPNE